MSVAESQNHVGSFIGIRILRAPGALAAVGVLVGVLLGLPRHLSAADTRSAGVPAPELAGNSWLNVPPGQRLSLASRQGKVTVVHFWTFGCVNCKRNLPFYAEWQKRFSGRGLEIIGVHTPETQEERDPAAVAKKVREYGITYPVLIDDTSANWRGWQQRCWPTVYLVDKRGIVRFAWEGELEYQGAGGNAKVTQLIEKLLNES